VSSDEARAGEFAELFRAVYLTFHRRDRPRSQPPNASLAVLEQLALAGPLTIGEAAAHLHRAQSVVSEIVSHLERQGMAGPAQSWHATRGDRTPDPRLHGHDARLARPPPRRLAGPLSRRVAST
jgi:DNA-binding IclR family transcriptional regulator